jgi:hypothetical protein
MPKLPFVRKPERGEPLVVTMTGVRLGDKVIFAGSDPTLLMPLAARVGLSGQLLVVSAEGQTLRQRAEREGLLVEAASAPPADGTFDLAVIEASGAWQEGLGTLAAAVRPAGRAVVIAGGQAQGLLARLGGRAGRPEGPDAATIIHELVLAGWTRARSVGEGQGLRFVEAVRS